MSTQIDNFTVTDVNFSVPEGQNIAATQASAIITLTPNAGYSISAGDFSLIAPVPSEINGPASAFSQDGDNVILTAVFINPSIMPQANVSIPICVDGSSSVLQFTLDGTYSITTVNALPASTTAVPYSLTGNYESNLQVLDVTLNATTDNYFTVEPTLFIGTGVITDYAVVSTDTINADGYLTGKNFVVNYIFPNGSVTGDVIKINGSAIEIPEGAAEEVRSYSISSTGIALGGENRVLTLTGGGGADWAVTAVGTGLNFSDSGVLPSSGISNITIPFPAGSGVTYTIGITGDLLTPFPLTNPFTLVQAENVDINFTPSPTGGFTVAPTTTLRSAQAGSIPLSGSNTNSFIINYVITAPSTIIIDNVIENSDWIYPTLDGFVVSVNKSTLIYTTPGVFNSVTLKAQVVVAQYGQSDIVVGLDLSQLISIPTTYASFASSSNQGGAITCSNTTQTYYFNGTQGNQPVNGSLVFSDALGVNPLATGNYVLSNSKVIIVSSGAVSAVPAACSSVTILAMDMSTSHNHMSNACASTDVLFTPSFANNAVTTLTAVYTDTALSTLFIGDGGWYRIDIPVIGSVATTISSLGLTGSVVDICSEIP